MQEHVLSSDDFLVSQTDEKGIILYANEDFCNAAGFKSEELLGQPHNIVRHPDMPRAAFEGLWKTIKEGKIWSGYVKNRTKSGGFYWVYATVFPMYDDIKQTNTYMSCRRKPSPQMVKEAEELYKTLS